MANFKVEYIGNLQCKATHSDTEQTFLTDAKDDSKGISPTDLLAASLATCTASMIAFSAQNRGISVDGLEVVATRVMDMKAYAFSSIKLVVVFKNPISEEELKVLKAVAKACPVKKALKEDIQIDMEFINK
ncbi:MAG: OsmC family protein [Bdellovibrionota bacterium]